MVGQKPCMSFTPKPPCTDIYSNLSTGVYVSWKEAKKILEQKLKHKCFTDSFGKWPLRLNGRIETKQNKTVRKGNNKPRLVWKQPF